MSAAPISSEECPIFWRATRVETGRELPLAAVELDEAIDETISRARIPKERYRVTIFASAYGGTLVGAEIVVDDGAKRYRVESVGAGESSER